MDSEDSGPRCILSFLFTLLVLLIQLDVWECMACSYPSDTAVIVCNIDPEDECEDEFRRSYHYNLRSAFPVPRLLFSVVFREGPVSGLTGGKWNLPVYASVYNNRTYAVCCVYLI